MYDRPGIEEYEDMVGEEGEEGSGRIGRGQDKRVQREAEDA